MTTTAVWTVSIKRTTYDGLCAYLQKWSDIYKQPGAMVLVGTIRNPFSAVARAYTDVVGGAGRLAEVFEASLNGLGMSKVGLNETRLDLRDLTEDQGGALQVTAYLAKLRPAQTRAMEDLSKRINDYMTLPDMIKIAIAASE